MKELVEQFKLSPTELERVIDSLDETGGFLIKGSELKYWIEYYVNKHRNCHEGEDARVTRGDDNVISQH